MVLTARSPSFPGGQQADKREKVAIRHKSSKLFDLDCGKSIDEIGSSTARAAHRQYRRFRSAVPEDRRGQDGTFLRTKARWELPQRRPNQGRQGDIRLVDVIHWRWANSLSTHSFSRLISATKCRRATPSAQRRNLPSAPSLFFGQVHG